MLTFQRPIRGLVFSKRVGGVHLKICAMLYKLMDPHLLPDLRAKSMRTMISTMFDFRNDFPMTMASMD